MLGTRAGGCGGVDDGASASSFGVPLSCRIAEGPSRGGRTNHTADCSRFCAKTEPSMQQNATGFATPLLRARKRRLKQVCSRMPQISQSGTTNHTAEYSRLRMANSNRAAICRNKRGGGWIVEGRRQWAAPDAEGPSDEPNVVDWRWWSRSWLAQIRYCVKVDDRHGGYLRCGSVHHSAHGGAGRRLHDSARGARPQGQLRPGADADLWTHSLHTCRVIGDRLSVAVGPHRALAEIREECVSEQQQPIEGEKQLCETRNIFLMAQTKIGPCSLMIL